jgi:hypothetical protein
MSGFVEYPKALYGPKGWDDLADCWRVHNAEEEADARADGYKTLAEPRNVEPTLEIATLATPAAKQSNAGTKPGKPKGR